MSTLFHVAKYDGQVLVRHPEPRLVAKSKDPFFIGAFYCFHSLFIFFDYVTTILRKR